MIDHLEKDLNMKLNKYLNISLVFFLLLIWACKTTVPSTGEVVYKGVENKGDVLAMEVRGYGTDERDAIFNAEKRGVEVLLFQGIPGSPYSSPMVVDVSLRNSKSAYFSKLLDERGYQSFVIESKPIGKAVYDKINRKKSINIQMKLNVLALRKELELNNASKKFGFK